MRAALLVHTIVGWGGRIRTSEYGIKVPRPCAWPRPTRVTRRFAPPLNSQLHNFQRPKQRSGAREHQSRWELREPPPPPGDDRASVTLRAVGVGSCGLGLPWRGPEAVRKAVSLAGFTPVWQPDGSGVRAQHASECESRRLGPPLARGRSIFAAAGRVRKRPKTADPLPDMAAATALARSWSLMSAISGCRRTTGGSRSLIIWAARVGHGTGRTCSSRCSLTPATRSSSCRMRSLVDTPKAGLTMMINVAGGPRAGRSPHRVRGPAPSRQRGRRAHRRRSRQRLPGATSEHLPTIGAKARSAAAASELPPPSPASRGIAFSMVTTVSTGSPSRPSAFTAPPLLSTRFEWSSGMAAERDFRRNGPGCWAQSKES